MKDLKSVHRGVASIPSAVLASFIIGLASITTFKSINVVDNIVNKVGDIRVAQQVAQSEMERIRTLSYNDVIKLENVPAEEVSGFTKELVLGKEYREDIANTVMKHKPFTVKIFKSGVDIPLVTIKGEKTSRWYKSGSFDNSNLGIYDETEMTHAGTVRKTGYGTGYVFLKKGAQVNGDVEIYDETNGDVYIYNSIGSASSNTVIRHVGPSTSSGYIRLSPSCTISGTVTLENSSNGGMIIENNLKNVSVSKQGNGTGYLMLSKGSTIGGSVKVYNESAGAILVNGTLSNGSVLKRTGDSDGLLVVNGNIRGTVVVNMEKSGKVTMNGTCYDGTVINYLSETNKSLVISTSNVSGNVSFVNNGQSTLEFTGKITDGCKLNASGIGSGIVQMSGQVMGNAYIVNDTSGSIMCAASINDGKTLKKIGGGVGFLSLDRYTKLEGDFTVDFNGYGFFRIYGGTDRLAGYVRGPVFYDGTYFQVLDYLYNEVRLNFGVIVQGKVTLNTRNNPYRYIGFGKYQNVTENFVDLVLPDGYVYTVP